jgi:predicted Ser/Thr protein kinase
VNFLLILQVEYDQLEFNRDEDEIGQGCSAVVYKGNYNGQAVAIKMLVSSPDYREFEKELDILRQLRANPDIPLFVGACIHDSQVELNNEC